MNLFVLLISFLFLKSPLCNVDWKLKEEWISQHVEYFDCHSSSIIETSDNRLLAVWKGGPGKGKSNTTIKENVGIWCSQFNGLAWSTPEEIISCPDSVCWTPVVCKDGSGHLKLFYRIGPHPRHVVSFSKQSLDNGLSWTQEEKLPAGIMSPTKNKPIISSSDVWIIPTSIEIGNPEDSFKETACWIEISPNNGHDWERIGPLEIPNRKFGVIEPALFCDKEGHLRMMCRDRANRIDEKGYIWMAISEDEGHHWSELKQTSLPNPDSGIDVVDLGNGKLFLLYNHSHTKRSPLNLAISLDGGDTWSQPLILDKKGEFPSGCLSSDGYLHVTFASKKNDSKQRGIKHVVVDPIKLINSAKFN